VQPSRGGACTPLVKLPAHWCGALQCWSVKHWRECQAPAAQLTVLPWRVQEKGKKAVVTTAIINGGGSSAVGFVAGNGSQDNSQVPACPGQTCLLRQAVCVQLMPAALAAVLSTPARPCPLLRVFIWHGRLHT
jgi:hypothetical protein